MNSRNIFTYLTLTLCGFVLLPQHLKAQQGSLQDYIKIGISENPGLQAQKLSFLATEKDIDLAGEFSDPELSVSFYTKPMDIIGGRSTADFTLMQSLPWFGTKKSAKSQAKHNALAAYQDYQIAKQELIVLIKTQWYILLDYQQQLISLKQNLELLEQLKTLALQKYTTPQKSQSTSSNSMSDVLRIGLEILETQHNITNTQALLDSEKGKFNLLINQKIDNPVDLPTTLKKVDFLPDTQANLQLITTENPAIEKINQQALAYQAKGQVDKKMSYPMIGIGLQYMVISKTSDPMFAMGSMNGKDMIMPMVSVSLPVFRKKYKAQDNQNKLWWESSSFNKQQVINQLSSDYLSYIKELENASRTIDLYEKQTELAKTTYQLIVTEFSAGKNDLTNLFQVQSLLIDYQLKHTQAIVAYNTLVASIESLMPNTYTNTLNNEQ
ncbi:TolC family protein [Myroides sp. LJL119]